MRRGYRGTRPTTGSIFEYRTLHSTGDQKVDDRRREEMLTDGWEWFSSEVSPRAVGLSYHFRRRRG